MAHNSLGSRTIASGTTHTDAIDCNGGILAGFQFGTIASTVLTFTADLAESGTFVSLTDTAGAAISYTIASDTAVTLDPAVFAGVDRVKCVFDQTETSMTFHYVIHDTH